MKSLTKIISGALVATSIALSSPGKTEAVTAEDKAVLERWDSALTLTEGVGAGSRGLAVGLFLSVDDLVLDSSLRKGYNSRIMADGNFNLDYNGGGDGFFGLSGRAAFLNEFKILSKSDSPMKRLGLEMGPVMGTDLIIQGEKMDAATLLYGGIRSGYAAKIADGAFAPHLASPTNFFENYVFLDFPVVGMNLLDNEGMLFGGGITLKMESNLGESWGMGVKSSTLLLGTLGALESNPVNIIENMDVYAKRVGLRTGTFSKVLFGARMVMYAPGNISGLAIIGFEQ